MEFSDYFSFCVSKNQHNELCYQSQLVSLRNLENYVINSAGISQEIQFNPLTQSHDCDS
jgi:hypothetical protein